MTAPALAVHVRGKGRHYEHPETGLLVPSVTNCIGVLDKPAIPRWAAKQVAETAWKMRTSLDGMGRDDAIDVLKGSPWRTSGRAADRGGDVHTHLEAVAAGRTPPPLEGSAARWAPAVDEWLEAGPEFVHAEFTVFGDGYAGTGDFIARLDGRLLLGDYKTSAAGRVYQEVALQLAALRHADLMVVDGEPTPMPPVDGTVAVALSPDGCRIVQVDSGPESFEAFKACVALWEWVNGPDRIGG